MPAASPPPIDDTFWDSLIASLCSAKHIVAIIGAGASTRAGIRDFRGPDGLYTADPGVLKHWHRAVLDRTALDDHKKAGKLLQQCAAIHQQAASVGQDELPHTHQLLRTLKEHGRLQRVYSQNVDGLEQTAGLEPIHPAKLKSSHLVQLHGSIRRVRCDLCDHNRIAGVQTMAKFAKGEQPDCPSCKKSAAARLASGRRARAIGKLRPAVLLYGEAPSKAETDLILQAQAQDLAVVDCVLIMGTSLQIRAVNKWIEVMAAAVHARHGFKAKRVIYINATPLAGAWAWNGVIDNYLQGTCELFVSEVHPDLVEGWELQQLLTSTPSTVA